jgi:hypothetical protein
MTPSNPFDERSQKVTETISFKKPKHAAREEAPTGAAAEPEKEADWFEEDGASPIDEEASPKKEKASAQKKKQKREREEEPPKKEKREN